MHPVVYERGEDIFVGTGTGRCFTGPDTFTLEPPAVSDLFNHRNGYVHSRGNPGLYGGITELG